MPEFKLDKYNIKKHSSIRMTPIEASKPTMHSEDCEPVPLFKKQTQRAEQPSYITALT